MENNFSFVPMTKADLPQLAQYAAAAFSVKQLQEKPWTKAKSLQHLQENFNPHYSWTIKLNHQIIGGAVGLPVTFQGGTELFIDTLVISKPHRSQGVGTKFLDFLEQETQKKGLVGFILLSNTKLPSYNWYHHLGFKTTGWVELSKKFTSQS